MIIFFTEEEINSIKQKSLAMNEKERRQFFYRLSFLLGRGGKSYIASVFNVSRVTLNVAERELENGDEYFIGDKIRREKYVKDNSLSVKELQIKNIKFELSSCIDECTKAGYLYDSLIRTNICTFIEVKKEFNISLSLLYKSKIEYEYRTKLIQKYNKPQYDAVYYKKKSLKKLEKIVC